MQQAAPLVLTVDDDPAGRYIKTKILREAGFEALEAETGRQGLSLVDSYRPQIVLLDVRLPDIDGLQVCEEIKRSYPGTPVLQMSATFTGLSDRIRGLENGADAYLAEPVEPQELIATVRSLLRTRKVEQDLRDALETNRLLLEELQHRIKNTLQLVTSLLSLEERRIEDACAQRRFAAVRDRIAIVTGLYGLLAQAGSADRVDVHEFLGRVVRSCRALTESVDIHNETDSVELSVDRAIPLGLIAQELVTNALKHAFPSGRKGRISLRLTRDGRSCRLEVADDGIGFKSDAKPGSGSRLVEALVQQLAGTLRHDSARDCGASVIVDFPQEG